MKEQGIPMDPICPRCEGKHGVEVSGDGYEWDCAACGQHIICAIGPDGGEMYPYHREDGRCGCEREPHTCNIDDEDRAETPAEADANEVPGPNGCTCGFNGDCNCPFVATEQSP